jgi:hypothetical protein
MNGATIQSRIWKGYGKAALFIGSTYRFYRPVNSTTPADLFDAPDGDWDGGEIWDQPGNFLASLPVSLNAEDMKYSRPNKYGKATWYALVDGTSLQPGDYFFGAQGMFFIAALQPLLPILVVECNRVISVKRPQTQSGTGLIGNYGGNTADTETAFIAGRPCSILQGTKGEKSETSLPGDTRTPWWTVLLPDTGTMISPDDIIVDDLDQRYVVSSNERTDLGWRLTAMIAVA